MRFLHFLRMRWNLFLLRRRLYRVEIVMGAALIRFRKERHRPVDPGNRESWIAERRVTVSRLSVSDGH